MKVTKMETQTHNPIARLRAACHPFGSLEAKRVSVAMLAVADALSDETLAEALRDLDLALDATDADQIATREAGRGWCTVVTPTSRTHITLRTSSPELDRRIEIDFGPEGSTSRACTILAASGAPNTWTVTGIDGAQLSRDDVQALYEQGQAWIAPPSA